LRKRDKNGFIINESDDDIHFSNITLREIDPEEKEDENKK